MIKPAAARVDLGLILAEGTACTDRLESAATFNALFTHRVRLAATTEIDDELRTWLRTAYDTAG